MIVTCERWLWRRRASEWPLEQGHRLVTGPQPHPHGGFAAAQHSADQACLIVPIRLSNRADTERAVSRKYGGKTNLCFFW